MFAQLSLSPNAFGAVKRQTSFDWKIVTPLTSFWAALLSDYII